MIHKSFNCNLNQLTSFSRGDLSDANSDGLLDTVASPSCTQAWNLDALGNWSTITTNSTSQSRTHNAQNQVTGVGSTSLTYDANGSMTADESGRVFVYDAWNRLVAVRNSANSPIVGYSYDALSRRIIEDRPNANTVDHLYYSTGWQVLEERRDGTSSGDVRRQYLWSIDYVDALTARLDYASGAVTATYHAQYDANWNITAIANASTGVLERYIYDPYGTATVLYANWAVRGGSPYGWNYLHQGGRLDVDSNLNHFRHRDYSATLGRWTQTDPIGIDAGDLNLFRYVGNGPVSSVDSMGFEVQHFSGPYGPRWNDSMNVAEIYFIIDYTPSWFNYIQPWYSPSPSKIKSFPVPTLGKAQCTPSGLANLDYNTQLALEIQIAYATGIQFGRTTGYNNKGATADQFGMAVVGVVASSSVQFFKNMSRADCHMSLRNSGFDFHSKTKGGYVRYRHPDGSEVWIRPNGEIIRLGPKVKPSGGGRLYNPRIDNRWNPIDTHSTGEYLSPLKGFLQ